MKQKIEFLSLILVTLSEYFEVAYRFPFLVVTDIFISINEGSKDMEIKRARLIIRTVTNPPGLDYLRKSIKKHASLVTYRELRTVLRAGRY